MTVNQQVAKRDRDFHGLPSLGRWPNKVRLTQPEAWSRYFIGGLAPAAPIISQQTKIIAFGSCFAQNISKYLSQRGYVVNAHNWRHGDNDLIRMDELMVHTPALLAQFEWAFNKVPLPEVVINDEKVEVAIQKATLDEARDLIISADVYIVTFGLTEAWYDVVQQTYLWKLVPKRDLNLDRFVRRRIGFDENLSNIERIYRIIRTHNPAAKVIFTLSPIPLIGTYRDLPVVPANTASKATLRACLDEFFERNKDDEYCFYFPSYEIVHFSGIDFWQEDNRHPKWDEIENIMVSFEKHFCCPREVVADDAQVI